MSSCFANCRLCFLPDQPPNLEWITADHVFVKLFVLAHLGTIIPQHSHLYDHTTLVVSGSVRVWADDEDCLGDFKAPCPIHIKAGVKHSFQTLEENTNLMCIHRLDEKAVEPPILEEHVIDYVDSKGELLNSFRSL